MDEQILDASAIDSFDDFDLTGEYENEVPLEETTKEEVEESLEIEDTEESEETDDTKENDDFTLEVLRLKGISDPSKIKFLDESGAIIERDWNDLTDLERLNILVSEGNPETDLEDDEIELINTIRESNLTPQQYLLAMQQQAVKSASELFLQSQTPVYEIDSLSDDELFALDLLEKVGEENITDEELQEALEAAKANESLFAKQIEGLRATYKNLEDLQRYNAELAQLELAELQYQEFSNKVLNLISSFNSFANLEIELSTDDKNDLANYILTRRDSGISDFYSDMQDPATATLAAFWLLRGPEVLSEMEEQVKAAYQRGYAIGKAQTPQSSLRVAPKTPLVVVQTPKTTTSTLNADSQSAFSLGDESYLN